MNANVTCVNRVRLVPTLVLALGALASMSGAIGGVDETRRLRASVTPAERAAARLAIEHLPLLFVENQGQTDPAVSWYLEGRGLTAFFAADGVTYAVAGDARRWSVKLDFVGANPDVKPQGTDPAATVFSYFTGPREQWHTGVPSCTTLVYRDLWPGIDLTYTAAHDTLKYAFTVRPGADPSRIRIACRGAQVRVEESGGLELATPLGDVRDETPTSWQVVDGRMVDVPTAFRVVAAGDGAASYGFEVGSFDASLPLVIDPAVVIYAGYIGGTAKDYGTGIAVDADGFAYVTGHTASSVGFPTAAGPDASYNDGSTDAFVAKVAADGSGLVYAGYIGGNGGDFGFGIAVDLDGSAYVTGPTGSNHTTFPVITGPDLTSDFEEDQFVAKVDPTGTALVYCGYVAGTTSFGAIAVDDEGAAYVTGAATNPDAFPAELGPDLTYNGGTDAFVAKVSPDGSGFVFAGYLGGSGGDAGVGIAVDADHRAYLTGHTNSTQKTFPKLGGPDLTYGGNGDAWVARVSASGEALEYCGFIGGSGVEASGGIAIDAAGAAYVTGSVTAPTGTFLATVGPDVTHNGGTDAFIAKVAANGTGLVYAGYIGGADSDFGSAVAVDADRNAYVMGNTSSDESTFPVHSGPDLTYAGGLDAFIARVGTNGLGLVYCGYLGGDGEEFPLFAPGGLALDSAGNAYVTGGSSSTQASFDVVGGPDTTHNGLHDAFIVKVDPGPDDSPPAPPVTLDISLVKGSLRDSPKPGKDRIKVKGGLAFTAKSPDGSFDPATDAVFVSIGDSASMFEFEVPAADVGWKSTTKGKHTWKSAKGALPRLVVVVDPAKLKFSVAVTNGVFAATPETLVHVSLVAGDDAGAFESTWLVKKPGSLTFVP